MATDQEIRDLAQALRPLAQHAVQAKGKMGEENTKFKIVVPILHALGWPSERMDLEYSVGGQSVDVALCDENEQPLVFVEVKGLNVTLKPDAKEVDQALGYAFKAGTVRWAALTNGLLWWAYDCHARLPTDRRRFLAADLGLLEDSEEAVARQLIMLRREAVSGGSLAAFAGERLWQQEITRLFSEGDSDLLDLLRHKVGLQEEGLSPAVASLSAIMGGTPPPPPPLPAATSPPAGGGRWIVRIGTTEQQVKWAREVLVLAAQHLVDLGLLTPQHCPVKIASGHRLLVHTSPIHQDGRRFRAPVEIEQGM